MSANLLIANMLRVAKGDLDDATRCGFRLHEADAHLGLARLSLAEGAPAQGG